MVAPNQITEWEEALRRIRIDSDALADSLSPAQFNWRPAPGKWSVGECFDHLAIATGLMLSRVRPVIDRGQVKGIMGTPPFRYGMLGGWFVRMMETPPVPGKRPRSEERRVGKEGRCRRRPQGGQKKPHRRTEVVR